VTLIERTTADLLLIAEYWPGLASMREPAVRRPHREPTITAEAREELDHQARIERFERIDIAPGEHIDAVRPEVLDMMGGLLIAADGLAELVARAVWCPRLQPPSTAFADPTPWLSFTAAHLADADARYPNVLHHVASEVRGMVAQLDAALGLSYDGQRLQAICPWCNGAILGDRTLRVVVLPGDQVGITCTFTLCSPPLGDVGTWWKGRPVWPLHMWPWLAKRVWARGREPVKTVIRYREACEAAPQPDVLGGVTVADWEARMGL
jgi:hypothetical protein